MIDTAAPRLALVAGEVSGDLLAGLLLRGLRQTWPELQAAGVGGPQMQRQGLASWWPHEKLAVFGFVDALKRYPELLLLRHRIGNRVLAEAPRLFIGVDAPDFNLGLEQRLRRRGVKTVHFVCPSIWAWRGHRVQGLKRAADHVLCLFPFEPALLAEHGIAATYVGHPLADAIALQTDKGRARQNLGLAGDVPVVALLPGSRSSETRLIAPRIVRAAALMHAQRPHLQFVLPAVPSQRGALEQVLAAHVPGLRVKLLEGRSHEALAACDVTLIASGTATLEAALFRRPMVITYAVSPLNWWRMRGMGYLPWVGLPNILCRDFVVPELIQDAATPEALARETLAWLDAPQRVQALQQRFETLHHELRRDTARSAAHAIAQVLAG
jgi:lipid-A-disaccharide synthase